MRTSICLRCGQSFDVPGRRGRPPQHCSDECRRSKHATAQRVHRAAMDPEAQAESRARHAARQRERRAQWTPEERERQLAAQRARAQARYVPKPRVEPARDPANPCPHCSGPMRPRQRKHCGAVECRKAFNRERTNAWLNEYVERTGTHYAVERYSEQRRAYAKANPGRQRWPDSARAGDERRRARKLGLDAEVFDRREVFDRDGWVCGICTEPVDPELKYPDPRSASLDHEVPLSLGGPHTRANSRCSHLECNVRRGARIETEVAQVAAS